MCSAKIVLRFMMFHARKNWWCLWMIFRASSFLSRRKLCVPFGIVSIMRFCMFLEIFRAWRSSDSKPCVDEMMSVGALIFLNSLRTSNPSSARKFARRIGKGVEPKTAIRNSSSVFSSPVICFLPYSCSAFFK